jgi:uncharacterized protein YqeY
MNLEQKIMAELKTAMLAKNEAALRALRAVKSAIILAKTSGSNVELSEADEMKLLQKLVKQRKESLDIFTQQNRADLAKNEEDEIAVIEKFLPAMMSADEVKEVLKGIITSMGATQPSDMGKVMGAASKQLAGKADNKMISELVKNLLSGG